MKEGWKYSTLGECASFARGLTYSKRDEADVSDKIVLRSNNVELGTGRLVLDELKYLTPSFEIPDDKRVKKGSLLMCMSNGSKAHLGKVALIENDLPYAFGGFMGLVTPNEDLDSKYFFYSLSTPTYKDFIKSLSAGANINNIKVKDLQQFVIPLPPLSEQQRIVSHLDSSFAKIDALKTNAGKMLDEAKALFAAALREAMKPKEGWEEKKLGEVCSIKSVLVDPQLEEYRDLIHVGGANIESMSGKLVDLLTASQEGITSGKFYFDDKVVLYNKIRPYLVKVSRPNFCGLCSADMYPLTPNEHITKDFLYYVLISKDFTDYAILGSSRAGMPKVNRNHLFAYCCVLPPLPEQSRIVSHLDNLSAKVRQLEANFKKVSEECDALKQAILRETFE